MRGKAAGRSGMCEDMSKTVAKHLTFIYTGNSMFPTLRKGDLIVLEAGQVQPIR